MMIDDDIIIIKYAGARGSLGLGGIAIQVLTW